MGEFHHDDSGQIHFSKEKSNNRSSTGNSKNKNLVCNWRHKKGHIRVDCWTRIKKQIDPCVTELAERDEEKCDILYITDRSADNKDRWIIDFGCSQHISSNRKMFLLYTSIQEGEVFMGNSTVSKMIGKKIIQFQSHYRCITTFQGIHHVLNQGTILSLLESSWRWV